MRDLCVEVANYPTAKFTRSCARQFRAEDPFELTALLRRTTAIYVAFIQKPIAYYSGLSTLLHSIDNTGGHNNIILFPVVVAPARFLRFLEFGLLTFPTTEAKSCFRGNISYGDIRTRRGSI